MTAYTNLRKYIGSCLLEAYENREKHTYSLYDLLKKICNNHELSISHYDYNNASDPNRFQGFGKNGYTIITDSLFIVKELERFHIIQYYKQRSSDNKFLPIQKSSQYGDSFFITGSSYDYILTYWNQNIWISPQIESFVKHGFISEELVEAKNQTRYAKWTLIASVITMFFSVITTCTSRNDTIDLHQISPFYNYSTVDWAMTDTLYYRSYAADWGAEISERIHPEFPQEIAAEYWHRLQNAKTYFHQQSLPLRQTTFKRGRKALDGAEAMFDTVFLHCVEQEYYTRLFVDVYNEIMPSVIDDLITDL